MTTSESIAARKDSQDDLETLPPRRTPSVLQHADLWHAYKSDPDNVERKAALAEKFVPYVWSLACYFRRTKCKRETVEDLFAAGFVRLHRAMKSFAPDGGASFMAYSRFTILNAMQEVVNNRRSYAALWQLQQARHYASSKLGRSINDLELAETLGMTDAQLRIRQNCARRAFGLANYFTDEMTVQLAEEDHDIEQEIDVREVVTAAIATLQPREQKIVRLHYIEEIPLIEIAVTEGVTRQRVHQILLRSLAKLREVVPESDAEALGFLKASAAA